MQTIYKEKVVADKMYGKCDRCGKRAACPESTCMWSGVLASGGEGKIYCTAPAMDKKARITRFGQ